jgi:hypothetical protein
MPIQSNVDFVNARDPQRWPGRIDCPLCGVTQYAALPGHEGDPESHLTCDSCRRETQR